MLPSGYLMVRAMFEGKRIVGQASRVVWQNLHGDIPNGMIINHKNGIKDDNRPSNLEVSTYSENISHAHNGGLLDQNGQRNPNVKLTDREVAQIRLAYANGGYTMAGLAERFGVSFQAISNIVRGKSRPKQGGPIQNIDLRHCVCERNPTTGKFIGKKIAGRLLDGREWNEMPEVTP